MPSYPWISCHSSEYHALLTLAIAFGALYIVGIPALFAVLIIRYRSYKNVHNAGENGQSLSDYAPLIQHEHEPLLANPKQPHKLIKFLVESYTEESFWFEVVWITRKLLIAMALALVSSSLGQVSAVTFILTIGIAIQAWRQPYRDNLSFINVLEIVTCAVILITYNIGYHIKEFGSGTTKTVMQITLLGMNVLLALGFVVAMIIQLRKARSA
eukprot:CAMPEP_0168542598 /NCGR_PEP_ID=MMETSP0413-20121227/1430_1 /TAXON_ID=136452 /ORGANISM="Filamoeba nolandi, Strain NC-AS-23-1" /LENGTH=212 /DNA_ID=CAMNT_0008572479 /DNA_START=112 /DNA_END=746 /DNA_ORIENTATION=-